MLGGGSVKLGNGHGQFGVDAVGSVGNGGVLGTIGTDGVFRIVGSTVSFSSTAEVDGC
jgi:hypothetical protein